MKTKTSIITILFIFTLSSLFLSCKKDDDKPSNPTDPNEEEVITTLKLLFTDSAVVSPNVTATFRDLDGDGGNPPSVFDTIKLEANKTYLLEILLLNESVTPTDTISHEIAAEDDDHMFFFLHSGVNISTTYLDFDSNGLPLGLNTKWYTGIASSGTSKITLKHQPGIKDGTQAPGETDVEVTFQSRVD